MQINKDAVSIDHKVRFQKEFNNLTSSMQFMPWEIRAMSVAGACGLPMSALLTIEDTIPMIGSLAARLEHPTIKSFVTSEKSDFGLNMEWADWQNEVLASQHKNMFGIYSDSPVDILSEYRDVAKVLGREPANSAEYHRAKDAVLLQQRQEMEVHSKQVIGEMQARIGSLILTSDASKKLYESERDKTLKLEQELVTAVENTAAQVAIAIEHSRIERDAALTSQRGEIEKEHQIKTAMLMEEARKSMEQLSQKMDEIRSIYNEENYIPRQEYVVLLDEIDRERSQSRATQVKLNELNTEIARNKTIIAEQEQLVEALNNQMEDFKSNPGDALPVMFQSLQAKITTLQSYVERFREKNTELKGKLQTSQAALAKQKKEASSAKKMVKNLTRALVVLSVGAVICIGCLLLNS